MQNITCMKYYGTRKLVWHQFRSKSG